LKLEFFLLFTILWFNFMNQLIRTIQFTQKLIIFFFYLGHDEENKAPKNRLDALQEIVMKSKLYKLQKKEVKEEQENNREKLDKDYDELLKESLLDFNKKNKKYDKEDKNEEKEIIDEYDIALNAMLYDVKTKPTDRYVYICIYVYMHISMSVYAHVCVYVQIHTCLYMKMEKEITDEYDIALNAMLYDVKTKPTDRYIYIYMYMYIHVCIYVCMSVCTNPYISIYEYGKRDY
jgi:hypothetical protein